MELLPRDLALNNQTKEGLNKLQNLFSRHSGVGQNLVKTIVYWMLVFTSMTIKILNQSYLNHVNSRSSASMQPRHCLFNDLS